VNSVVAVFSCVILSFLKFGAEIAVCFVTLKKQTKKLKIWE